MGCGMDEKPGWIEIIRNLDEFDIRFNPTPWIEPEEFNALPKEENSGLLNLHLEVSQKVDDLIARMEQENGKSEIWDMVSNPSKDNDLTPEMITQKIEEIIVNR